MRHGQEKTQMEQMKRNPDAIARCIREARTVAVAGHVNPDGDTLGAAAAMYLAMKAMGKEVFLYCDGAIPEQLSFLPAADQFRVPAGNEGPFDLMLAVDVSDAGRLGKCEGLIAKSRMTAQIDHHPTNPLYMQVNSVDGKAPAASLLVREQLDTLGIGLDTEMAVCLYTGISTDTGNFAFSGTNKECFQVMSELMECGLPLAKLNRILFREKSREHIRLLGKAIGSLQFRGSGRIAVMKLTLQDFADCEARSEHADRLIDYALYTNDTRTAMLAREAENGQIKISLRSKEIAINDVAQRFGGGGHSLAAGITMPGTLDEVSETVLKALEEKLSSVSELL